MIPVKIVRLGWVILAVALGLLTACGGTTSENCTPVIMEARIDPPTATINHAAVAPANSQQFTATFQFQFPVGCVQPVVAQRVQWTTSDPSNVSLEAQGNTASATCLSPTMGPVNITAKSEPPPWSGSATASLTCR